MNLSAGAWATLIFASCILYGGTLYFILIAMHISPKDLMTNLNYKELKKYWNSSQNAKYMMVGFLGIILVIFGMYAAFKASPLPEGEKDGGPSDIPGDVIIMNWTSVREEVLAGSGSFAIGRPNTESDAAQHPFEVNEHAYGLYINVTSTGGTARPDLDLYLEGPSGNQVGSSASGGADEALHMDEKDLARAGPGIYTALVDPYTGLNLEYTITGVVIYHIPENETEPSD